MLIEKIKGKLQHNTNYVNGILFTFFSFINNGINFFLLMILATYLSPEGYGHLNLFNNFVIIFTVLIPLACTGYIANSFFRKEEKDFKQVIVTVFLIGISSFIFFIIIAIIAGGCFENILGLNSRLQILAICICFFQLFTTVNLDLWRLQEKPILYGIYSMLFVLSNFILTLLLIAKLNFDWEGRIYTQFIVGLIFCIISIIFLVKRNFLSFNKNKKQFFLKEILAYGLPLIPHMLSSWIRQGLDRYIINFFWNASAVGLFSFALNFGNIIHMVGAAFNASNSVSTYKILRENSNDAKRQLRRQTIHLSLFFFIVALIVYFVSYIFIPIIFPQYTNTLPYLFPICFGAFFQCIYYLFVNYLFYYKKTKSLMYTTFSVSILHFVLSFLLTKYSLLYIAYISLFSNFTICVIIIIISQKYFPIYKKK